MCDEDSKMRLLQREPKYSNTSRDPDRVHVCRFEDDKRRVRRKKLTRNSQKIVIRYWEGSCSPTSYSGITINTKVSETALSSCPVVTPFSAAFRLFPASAPQSVALWHFLTLLCLKSVFDSCEGAGALRSAL